MKFRVLRFVGVLCVLSILIFSTSTFAGFWPDIRKGLSEDPIKKPFLVAKLDLNNLAEDENKNEKKPEYSKEEYFRGLKSRIVAGKKAVIERTKKDYIRLVLEHEYGFDRYTSSTTIYAMQRLREYYETPDERHKKWVAEAMKQINNGKISESDVKKITSFLDDYNNFLDSAFEERKQVQAEEGRIRKKEAEEERIRQAKAEKERKARQQEELERKNQAQLQKKNQMLATLKNAIAENRAAEKKSKTVRNDLSGIWAGDYLLPIPSSNKYGFPSGIWGEAKYGKIILDLNSDTKRVTIGDNYYIVEVISFENDKVSVVATGNPGIASNDIIIFQFWKKMVSSNNFKLAFTVNNGSEMTNVSYCSYNGDL